MADDETNVVLTADVSGYERSIDQAANATNMLLNGVLKLTTAIDSAFKIAGKTMQIGGAGMVASITAAGYAAGRLESQMAQLSASTKMASDSQAQYELQMTKYSKSVTAMRSEFGLTSQEAINLVTQLNKLGQSNRNVKELSDSFTRLGAVSGEGVSGLVDGMVSLQRAMGTEGVRATKAMNAELAELSQTSGASATGILQFSNSLAPVAKMAGMSQREIMGVSTAFVKSGQDGYAAANAFNKMLTDITRNVQYGSPEIASYANLIGVSVDAFKAMPRSEAVTRIFEEINGQGPQALKTLERMGLDGVRSLKAIQGVAQSGGIRKTLAEAMGMEGGAEGKLQSSSKEAFGGLNEELKKMAENGKMIAEAFGSGVLPAMTKLAEVVNGILSPIRGLIQALGNLPGGAAAVAGMGLLAAGTVTKAFTGISTFGMAAGAYRTLRGGYRYGAGADNLSEREQRQINAFEDRRAGRDAPGNWLQHRLFGWGAASGEFREGMREGMGTPQVLGQAALPGMEEEEKKRPRGAFSGLRRAGITGTQMLAGIVGAGVAPLSGEAWDNNLNRDKRYAAFQSADVRDSLGLNKLEQARAGFGAARRGEDPAEAKAAVAATQRLSTGMNTATNSTKEYSTVTRQVLGEMKSLAGATAGAVGTMAKMGAIGTARVGAPMISSAWGGAKSLAGSAFGMLGGGMGIGLMAGMYGYSQIQEGKRERLDVVKDPTNFSPGAVYAAALGEAAAATRSFADVVNDQASKARTMGFPETGRFGITASTEETELVGRSRDKFTFEAMKNTNRDETVALISAMYATNPSDGQKQAMRLDLMRKYGNDAKGMTDVDAVTAQGRGSAVNLAPLYAATYDATTKIDSLSSLFKGGSGAPEKAKMTGSVIQELIAATGNSKQESLVTVASLNQLVKSNKASNDKKSWYGPGPSGQAAKQQAAEYVRGIMGEDGTEEDIDAVTDAIWDSGGDASAVRENIIKNAPNGIGRMLKLAVGDVKQLGFGVDTTSIPSSAFYKTSWQSAGAEASVMDQLRASQNPALRSVYGSPTGYTASKVIGALGNEADTNAQVEAANALADEMIRTTGGFSQAAAALDEVKSAAKTSSNALFQQAEAARGVVRARQAEAMPFMSQAGQAGQVMSNWRADVNTNILHPSPTSATNEATSRAGVVQTFTNTYERLKGFALQWREFEVGRKRGEEEYNKQRKYSEHDFFQSREYAQHDFDQSRAWSEEDYNQSRQRAEADYRKSQKWASEDFYRNRHRQEVEFAHQQEVMAEQTAKSMTNIYERLNVQRTWDAANLYQNMMDQQQKLAEQQQQLAKLRKAGLSNDAITQMGLNDPAQMQQLARLADDILNDPKMIGNFNKAAQDRIKAGKAIATDESNTQWTEMNRSFKLGMDNSLEDFRIAMEHQEEQYKQMRSRQQKDYKKMADHQEIVFEQQQQRQLKQFKQGLDRMEEAYQLGMTNARDDMNRSMTEITGGFNELADAALDILTGTANTQMTELLGKLGYTKGQVLEMTTDTVTEVNNLFRDLGITPMAGGGAKTSGGGTVMTGRIKVGNEWVNVGQLATGGEVQGYSPHPKADNIPIMATAGEFMQPVDSVNFYGKEFMEAVRDKRLPKFASGGMVYKQMEAWMAKNIPDTKVTSDYRPGAITALGNVSMHSQGKAVDMAPSMQAFNAILNAFGSKIHQLFYAPADGRTILRGKPWKMDPVTKGDHWNHVHWAMQSMDGLQGVTGGSGGLGWDGTYNTLFDMIKKLKGVSRFNSLMTNNSIPPLRQLGRDRMASLLALRGLAEAAVGGGTTGIDMDYAASGVGNGSVKTMVQGKAARLGWTGNNWNALDQLVAHESGWRPNAQNPSSSAYGLFQFLDSTWKGVGGHKTSDPALQADYGLKYIGQRYGNPAKAWSFWNSHTPHWYADGAVINGAKTIGVGEAGPEAVMPLNGKGVDFIFELMKKNSTEAQRAMLVSNGTVQRASNVSYYSRIDKSTDISGPITVQAQDPEEMLRKIQAKKNLEALKGRH